MLVSSEFAAALGTQTKKTGRKRFYALEPFAGGREKAATINASKLVVQDFYDRFSCVSIKRGRLQQEEAANHMNGKRYFLSFVWGRWFILLLLLLFLLVRMIKVPVTSKRMGSFFPLLNGPKSPSLICSRVVDMK